MTLRKQHKFRRGFSLAELLIVVAIIGILAGIAFVFVNPKDIDYVEYNRSAEAIATAVQNRLTEIKNSGDMTALRALGEQSTESAHAKPTAEGPDSGTSEGGYRYLFNYSVDAENNISKNTGMSYILPFGAIDSDIAKGYFAVGFQSDTGMCGEVFYSPDKFGACTTAYLTDLKNSEDKRKRENVGYYIGSWDDEEIAFANLPTPQLTITNYEELTLQIKIPKVKQLAKKKLGILISLTDEDGEAFKGGMTLAQAAIYSTFPLGDTSASAEQASEKPVVMSTQEVVTDSTYNMILDTVKTCNLNPDTALLGTPKDKFENWAVRSDATRTATQKNAKFKLGDNSVITVTVYCLLESSDKDYEKFKDFPVDPTYMPRSASVTFNGWFNDYHSNTADIACGRHLQNLNNLSEMPSNLEHYLPKVENVNGVYIYGEYDYGTADAYTEGSSKVSPSVDDVKNKYKRKSYVKEITKAQQINAIDFDNDGWKEKKDGETAEQILFTPVNLPYDFRYYGNYLTISHLKVDAPFYAGLFGYVYHVRLYDILLVNPSVTSQMPAHLSELYEMGVGALVGTSRDSDHINNCQVYMTQEKDGSYSSEKYRVQGECYVGGLIGFCEDEHIENCSASVYTGYAQGATKTVAEKVTTGGGDVATVAEGETVATKEVSVSSHYVGGLIGCITGDSNLDNCYAAGNLSGEYVGGLVGYLVEDSDPSGDDYRIETCYTAGHIEYASEEAAGLVGCIHELMGNTKSAVSIYGNYCVIIYGKKDGNDYKWDYKKTVDGEEVDVPIYGTFKGDGFEWISTNDMGYSDVYLKGKYAGFTFSAGAVFENDNKNYYIAQKGITYSNSPYFEATKNTLTELLDKVNSNSSNLKNDVEKAQDKIFWMKKLQALEELKMAVEDAIYEMDRETGKDILGNPYTDGGYSSHGAKVYLDKDDAEIVSSSSGNLQLTAQQALHAMYNGEYTDDEGTIQKIEITDQNHNKKDKNEEGAFDDFTFMGFYNALKKAYNDLIDDNTDNDDAAQKTLKFLFGDNSNETYQVTENGKTNEYGFYQAGRFYKSFYSNMFYRLFDKCKDYYQYYIKDNDSKTYPDDEDGTLLYYHFREDFAENRVCRLICDLGMSRQARDLVLLRAKSKKIEDDMKELEENLKIFEQWRDDETVEKDGEKTTIKHMKDDAAEAKKLTQAAIDALKPLKKLFDDSIEKLLKNESYYYTSDNLTSLMETAKTALNAVQKFFDGEDAYGDGLHRKDVVDYVGKDENGELEEDDMRHFRDAVAAYLRDVELCAAAANSGIGGAIDELAAKINQAGANNSELVEKFKEKINTYLGTGWNSADSGHNIKNAEQLRNAARGYVNGSESGTKEKHLGFMYDYGNKYENSSGKDENPYTNSTTQPPVDDDSYVDKDNGVYNNVFPFNENAFTHYYPFPFVFGLEVEGNEIPTTYILFHYGDWLTEDLWADETHAVTSVLNRASAQLAEVGKGLEELKAYSQSATTGKPSKEIDDLSKKVTKLENDVKTALKSTDTETQKTTLTSIRKVINEWITEKENGKLCLLDQIVANLNDNKEESEEIANKLNFIKGKLKNLVDEINEIIGE